MIILKGLRWIERTALVIIFVSMVVLFFFNIVARALGGDYASSFTWIEELVRLMNLFLVFGALGLALERGRHVGIDTLRDKISVRGRTVLLKTIDLIGICFSTYLVYQSYGLVRFVLATGQKSPTLDLPMGWIYVAPVLGFSLLGLRFTLSFFGLIQRFPAVPSSQDVDV